MEELSPVVTYAPKLGSPEAAAAGGAAVPFTSPGQPNHLGLEPVPNPTSFAFLVPRHEVAQATLHFRLVEERIVKVSVEREPLRIISTLPTLVP
jgi:hypothetical protein